MALEPSGEAAAEVIGIMQAETSLNKMHPEVVSVIGNLASSNGTGVFSRLLVLQLGLSAKQLESRTSDKPREISGRCCLVG